MRRTTILSLTLAAAALAACDQRPEAPALDTRTFELDHLDPASAVSMVQPYVYGDREGAPGMISMSPQTRTLSVRETSDNLDRIARVLDEHDRPPPSIRLRFQVIEADGDSEPDSAIADVEQELRRLFRYDGYTLIAQNAITAREGRDFTQYVGHGENVGYTVEGYVEDVRERGERPSLSMAIELSVLHGPTILSTSVEVVEGQALVLGTANPEAFMGTPSAQSAEGAVILVVRADIETGA